MCLEGTTERSEINPVHTKQREGCAGIRRTPPMGAWQQGGNGYTGSSFGATG